MPLVGLICVRRVTSREGELLGCNPDLGCMFLSCAIQI